MTEKKSMLILHTMPSSKRKGMALISPLDGSNWLTEKRTQSIHALKFGLNGPIVVNGKKFNNAMSAMGLSNQVADVMNYIMNSWSNKSKKIVTTAEVALVK
jgi:mono/diheme cytochrome c family protein